jgi:hypothetical protein
VFWLAAILFFQAQTQIQPGIVTGRLLNANGTPAVGIRIAAVPVPDNNDKSDAAVLVGISQTDSDGRYRLENIPPGRYYVFAGLVDFPSYYPNATSLDRATAIVVDAGATTAGINFSMARPAGLTIAGRLAVPSTMKISITTVLLTPQSNRGSAGNTQQVTVGSDGKFEFLRLSPGDYRLTSTLLGSIPLSVKIIDEDFTNATIPVVDCNAGARISGQLVGGSSSSRRMTLTGSASGCSPSTSVESDGSFAFEAVPEGTYRVQLSPMPLGWSGASLKVETADLAGITFRLPASVTMKGRALVDDGSLVPRTTRGTPLSVIARRMEGGEAGTSIMDDGSFELPLTEGGYRLSVTGIPSAYYLKSFTNAGADISKSILDVDAKSDKPNDIQITLGTTRKPPPQGVRLRGRVNFAATGALPNFEAVVLVSAGNRNSSVRTSSLAADGSFEFENVEPGTYNLETFPDNPAALYGIVVERADVTGIDFTVPVLIKVVGGIEWTAANGSTVPAARPNLSIQFTRRDGDRMLAWGALAQANSFHFYLPEGDYRFSVSDLPPEFNLSAVTAGDTNVLESGLRVRSDGDPPRLRVLLRR